MEITPVFSSKNRQKGSGFPRKFTKNTRKHRLFFSSLKGGVLQTFAPNFA